MNDQFANFFQTFQPANTQFTNIFQNMGPANEQFLGTVKASAEKQLAFFTTLAETTVDSVSKLADLNINACKASLEESKTVTTQFLAAKEPQEALQLLTALQQPTLTKVTAYNRHLANIASGAQTVLSEAIQEQVKETSRHFTEAINGAAKNAPAGSENVVAILRAAMANANAGYDQFNKATRQAAEVVQANVAASADQVTKVAEQVTGTEARTRK
jgi:phasin family protein